MAKKAAKNKIRQVVWPNLSTLQRNYPVLVLANRGITLNSESMSPMKTPSLHGRLYQSDLQATKIYIHIYGNLQATKIFIHTFICIYISVNIYTYIYMYIHIYKNMYIYIYISKYIYIYTRTPSVSCPLPLCLSDRVCLAVPLFIYLCVSRSPTHALCPCLPLSLFPPSLPPCRPFSRAHRRSKQQQQPLPPQQQW